MGSENKRDEEEEEEDDEEDLGGGRGEKRVLAVDLDC